MPDRRRYEMTCPIACALDLVGERWTLLILREILPGPLRFSEIKASVMGINATILSRRLDQMLAEGLIELVDLGTTTGYGATDRAFALWPVLLALASLGLQLPQSGPGQGLTPVAAVLAFVAARPVLAPQVAIGFSLGGARLEWQPGAARPPARKQGRAAVELHTTPDLLLGLVTGQHRPADLGDRLVVEGAAEVILDHLPA